MLWLQDCLGLQAQENGLRLEGSLCVALDNRRETEIPRTVMMVGTRLVRWLMG